MPAPHSERPSGVRPSGHDSLPSTFEVQRARWRAGGLALATVVLGVVSRRLPLGIPLWDKSAGDALYTVLVYFLAKLARPSVGPARLGAFAVGVSLLIELFQLTGIPAALPRVFRWVLGSTFAWHDVACYVVGGGIVVAADALARRARRTRATR